MTAAYVSPNASSHSRPVVPPLYLSAGFVSFRMSSLYILCIRSWLGLVVPMFLVLDASVENLVMSLCKVFFSG